MGNEVSIPRRSVHFGAAVLSQLAIYWAHLFLLPASIIKKMNSLTANFLWGGKSQQTKLHLVKMDSISKPKNLGGWGLLHLKSFGKALLCKSLLRGIYGRCPWSSYINQKYLKGRPMIYWYRRNMLGIKSGSAIWQSFRKALPFFMKIYKWKLSTGSNVFIGVDRTILNLESMIPPDLLSFFLVRGFCTWNKLISSWSPGGPIWKNEADLLLPPHLYPIWQEAVHWFAGKGFSPTGDKDELIWALEKPSSSYSVKDIYAMISKVIQPALPTFPLKLWKASCPLKMILFSWLMFSNKNLSWEVLQRKGWQGPGRCPMCLSDVESNIHMFFQCPATASIWYELSVTYRFSHQSFSSIQDAFAWWSSQSSSRCSLFVISCWFLWTWRNEQIFNSSFRPLDSVLISISGLMAPLD